LTPFNANNITEIREEVADLPEKRKRRSKAIFDNSPASPPLNRKKHILPHVTSELLLSTAVTASMDHLSSLTTECMCESDQVSVSTSSSSSSISVISHQSQTVTEVGGKYVLPLVLVPPDKSRIPPANILCFESILDYSRKVEKKASKSQPQSFREAQRLLTSGCISAIHVISDSLAGLGVGMCVRSEFHGNDHYVVKCTLLPDSFATSCVCIAKGYSHIHCKHKLAALLALFLYANDIPKSQLKWFTRPGASRFDDDPSNPTYLMAELGLTYEDVKKRFLEHPPRRFTGSRFAAPNIVS